MGENGFPSQSFNAGG